MSAVYQCALETYHTETIYFLDEYWIEMCIHMLIILPINFSECKE